MNRERRRSGLSPGTEQPEPNHEIAQSFVIDRAAGVTAGELTRRDQRIDDAVAAGEARATHLQINTAIMAEPFTEY
jgi:hypothetical protein